MKWWLCPALLLLVAPALHAAEADPLAAIDACVARLDPQIDVGYERISARCPDLTRTLEQSGWAAWLPREWKDSRNDLSAGSLAELRTVVARELATPAAQRTPRISRLNPVLTDLGAKGQERSGAWARFKKWLRAIFEKGGQRTEDSWLHRMVLRVGVSDAVIELITYIAMGAVVALAALIVMNELRAAGVFARTRRRRPGEGKEVGASAEGLKPTWSDVERASLAERPRLLLELVAATLTDLRLLPPASALTVRELTRVVALREDSDRSRLAELALTAERARYADGGIAPSALESAVERGRELLTRLEAREIAAPGGSGAGT